MKIINITEVDAPKACQWCGQYLIKPYLVTKGTEFYENKEFCSISCVNLYFGLEKIANGEIVFKSSDTEKG